MSAEEAKVSMTWVLNMVDPLEFTIDIRLQGSNVLGNFLDIIPQVGPALTLNIWLIWHLMNTGTGMYTGSGIDLS